jgi:hypothetical protein
VLALAPNSSPAGLIYTASASTSDGPVAAEADFTFGTNTVTIVLTNTLKPDGSIVSIGQAISGLIFSIAPPPASSPPASLQSVTGDLVTITKPASKVVTTDSPGQGTYTNTTWFLGDTLNQTTGLTMDVFSGGKPVDMILNDWDSNKNYPNANGSITDNHEPDFRKVATFILSVPGVTSGSTVIDGSVTFNFGTALGEHSVPGVPPPPPPFVSAVPEPASLILLGLGGLCGLTSLGITRRRRMTVT